MQRMDFSTAARSSEADLRALVASRAAGEDPRLTIERLNRSMVAYQGKGLDLPAGFLRLSRTLAQDCVAHPRMI